MISGGADSFVGRETGAVTFSLDGGAEALDPRSIVPANEVGFYHQAAAAIGDIHPGGVSVTELHVTMGDEDPVPKGQTALLIAGNPDLINDVHGAVAAARQAIKDTVVARERQRTMERTGRQVVDAGTQAAERLGGFFRNQTARAARGALGRIAAQDQNEK